MNINNALLIIIIINKLQTTFIIRPPLVTDVTTIAKLVNIVCNINRSLPTGSPNLEPGDIFDSGVRYYNGGRNGSMVTKWSLNGKIPCSNRFESEPREGGKPRNITGGVGQSTNILHTEDTAGLQASRTDS